jgi:hypothetical protein
MGYFETSAVWKKNYLSDDNDNVTGVENIFERLVHEILVSKVS